jgi:hypothetical protein
LTARSTNSQVNKATRTDQNVSVGDSFDSVGRIAKSDFWMGGANLPVAATPGRTSPIYPEMTFGNHDNRVSTPALPLHDLACSERY